jgi:pimeloyl-ACP methyl ester carboxylesterase
MHSVIPERISPNVCETGAGPPVVLLHSGAGDARDWRRFTAELGAGFHCAAADLYGSGRTPAWPGPGALTIDDQVELVETVVRRVGAPVHLCGHSYGGAIALRLAVTRPQLVRTLSVIEPQCYLLLRELADPQFDVSHSLWNTVRALFERGEAETAWRQFIDYFSGAGFWDRLRSEVQASFLSVSPIERWAVLFSNPMTVADLRQLHVRTLVLCGGNTTPPERRMCEVIADAAPGAVLETIGAAGHMSPMTHPKEVATRIAMHISGDERISDDRAGDDRTGVIS